MAPDHFHQHLVRAVGAQQRVHAAGGRADHHLQLPVAVHVADGRALQRCSQFIQWRP